MALKNDHEVQLNIKLLIGKVTKLDETNEKFIALHKAFIKKLELYGAPFITSKDEIDIRIDGFMEKFKFHGFTHEAKLLEAIYNKFISSYATQKVLEQKLSILKFLFAMSRSPTTFFAQQATTFQSKLITEDEEEIDWSAYLMEGIEKWDPQFSESDSDFSDLEESSEQIEAPVDIHKDPVNTHQSPDYIQKVTVSSEKLMIFGRLTDDLPKIDGEILLNDVIKHSSLKDQIQSGWFANPSFRDLPTTSHPDSNVALRWEVYLHQVSHGLIGGATNILLSEYKVIREIIWQLIGVHNSVVFKWDENVLVVNENVTVSSLRPFVFQAAIQNTFIPYILMLHDLRMFRKRVFEDRDCPDTYRGYVEAAMSIVNLAMDSIIELNREAAAQESTLTIISLGNRLRSILRDVEYLYEVHQISIMDWHEEKADMCCMNLLAKLYEEMHIVFEKYQLDICLTLYMESVYKYVRIIEHWFCTDQLQDTYSEFPVQVVDDNFEVTTENLLNSSKRKTIHMSMRNSSPAYLNNPLMRLISKEVFQFGRQVHLLSLLERLNLLNDTSFSIYYEWKEAVFTQIKTYFKTEEEFVDTTPETEEEKRDKLEKRLEDILSDSVMSPNFCKYTSELDQLENIVTQPDYFFLAAFSKYLGPQEEAKPAEKVITTYERIRALTTNIFPGLALIVAELFNSIFRSKYRNCGAVLKNVFLNEYHLNEHLDLMAKIYLFKADFIFPFYRSVFHKIENDSKWGNDIWLTFDLQDVLTDNHPELYTNVVVTIKDGWQSLLEDPLKTCTLINVQYKIYWPIDIIITARCEKMYKEMFYFILKIKWALYTLNHLQYSREEKLRRQKSPKAVKILLQRLDILRFGFTNIFAALQHYILGYVYPMCEAKFTKAFENAKDLDSLIDNHYNFVHAFHRLASRVRDYRSQAYGVYMALYLVRQLRTMWLKPGEIKRAALKKCEDGLVACHKNIFDVITMEVLR